MKRNLLFLLMTLVLPIGACAYDAYINGIYYNFSGNEAEVTSSNNPGSYSGILVIPEFVGKDEKTYRVTSIGEEAFFVCRTLTSITIPNYLTHIGSGAFSGCKSLTEVHIKDMEAWCKITFGESHSNPLYYAKHLYMNGQEIKDLTIPDSIATINNYAFYNCSDLKTITLPGSITSIGHDAFYGCSSLTDVYCDANEVPEAVSSAFPYASLKSATLHVPAGSIEEYKTTSPWSGFGNIVALPDNNDYFYYYNGSKIPLTLNENKVVVSIPKECYETSERIQANVQVLTTIGDNDFDIFVITRSDYEQLISLDSWEEDERNVVSSSCYFVGRYNDEVAASPYLNVKIKKEQDIDLLNAYVEEYKLRFDDYKPLLELWYVLSVTPETEKDPLQVANELYETGLFAESEPDLVPLGSLIGPEPFKLVTYTEGQMATIILPEEPEASKGKYYRLDRVEEGKIVFEQELHPQAHVPYIIVPNEDFSIDPSNMDLEGLSCDTASIGDVSFIGSYVSKELEQQEGCNIQLIDTTPDCSISFSEETGKRAFLVGALRAYLTWDDPYNQGGTRVPPLNKRGIVLRDYETGITSSLEETGKGAVIYNLAGQRLSNPQKGIYIKKGKKVLR